MTSVHVRGMTIDSEGEGPPIVMLHGLGGTSNSFQAMVPPILEVQDAARERPRTRAAAARREGMSAVADQLIDSALASATANDNPLAVAFVRESQDAEGFARSCEALGQAEKADHRLIDCPTLIVTGDEDAVGPPSIAQELADKIAAPRQILNRCGHRTPIEKLKECGKLLSEFLRGIPV